MIEIGDLNMTPKRMEKLRAMTNHYLAPYNQKTYTISLSRVEITSENSDGSTNYRGASMIMVVFSFIPSMMGLPVVSVDTDDPLNIIDYLWDLFNNKEYGTEITQEKETQLSFGYSEEISNVLSKRESGEESL